MDECILDLDYPGWEALREIKCGPVCSVSQAEEWRTHQVHNLIILEFARINDPHLRGSWYSASFVCWQNILWVAHSFLPSGVKISRVWIENLRKLRKDRGINSLLLSDNNNLIIGSCLKVSLSFSFRSSALRMGIPGGNWTYAPMAELCRTLSGRRSKVRLVGSGTLRIGDVVVLFRRFFILWLVFNMLVPYINLGNYDSAGRLVDPPTPVLRPQCRLN